MIDVGLKERLNKVLAVISSDSFLENRGRGNEIPFHIFDYEARFEMQVREYLDFLDRELASNERIKHVHINLFDLVLEMLEERGFLEKAIAKQKKDGNQALLKALRGPLHEAKIAEAFKGKVTPQEANLVLVSGVGSVYPMLRTHTLLENLQSILGNTPLVLFYPGEWDQKTFKLFGKSSITSNLTDRRGRAANYYRAFRLVT